MCSGHLQGEGSGATGAAGGAGIAVGARLVAGTVKCRPKTKAPSAIPPTATPVSKEISILGNGRRPLCSGMSGASSADHASSAASVTLVLGTTVVSSLLDGPAVVDVSSVPWSMVRPLLPGCTCRRASDGW